LGSHQNAARELLKRAVHGAFLGAVAPARTRRLASAGRQRVAVLCYHRVRDDLQDNVTLSVEAFAAQMALVRKRYVVVRPEDVAAGNIDRQSQRPIVAVTFDDGYQDNFANAAPVLLRHKIPATFFISTGIVGTDRGFHHDLEKLGRTLPAMTWDEVRALRDAGFGIGSHTVSHANLARIGDCEARTELVQSRDDLRRELVSADFPFAYCFGGRRDITPGRRALVREVGYTCCFAAFGGTNDGIIDPFDIRRFGVNWAVGRPGFMARIEGWA